jgi:hypothetical protein
MPTGTTTRCIFENAAASSIMICSLLSDQACQHAGRARSAVGFHPLETHRLIQRGHHGVSDGVRRFGRKLHAPARAVTLEPMRDVEVLLKVIFEREVEEWRSGSDELHAGAETALDQGEIAGGEVPVENAEAIKLAKSKQPGLILADIQLDGSSGLVPTFHCE